MIKKIAKNLVLLLIIALSLVLVGCNNEPPVKDPEQPEKTFTVEYDELLYYSQTGKIKVTSIYEDDEIYIESLNTKVIKILPNAEDDQIAKAVGLGEAQIYISNYYGDEEYITIKVEAKEGFAPPIDNVELTMVEEGPYYINQTYHLQLKIYPELFNDTYYFHIDEESEKEIIFNEETLEISFTRAGKMEIAVVVPGKPLRVSLKVNVIAEPNDDSYSILFIGNSLTYLHDIPGIVNNMIKADGSYVVYSQDTVGGSYLASHEEAFDKLIDKYNFTHIILQGQSFEPINKKADFLTAMETLGNKGTATGAQLIVYQSWGYKRDYYGYTRDEQFAQLKASYDEAAQLIGAKVTRSGEAFQLFEATYGTTPYLYKDDTTDLQHQSIYGAYLSACVHYSTITGKRASDNTFIVEGIESEWIEKIQEVADKISFGE